MERSKLNNIIKISIFAAISFVLMKFFEFPIPFIWPSFLKFDMSEVPALIIGFSISPFAGVATVFLKNTMHFLMGGDFLGTMFANNAAGMTFVGVSSIMYSRKRSLKNAVIGLFLGTLAMTAIMMPVNRVLIPLWGRDYDETTRRLVFFMIPMFNIFKGTLNSILTYFLYKKISANFLKPAIENKNANNDRSSDINEKN